METGLLLWPERLYALAGDLNHRRAALNAQILDDRTSELPAARQDLLVGRC